VSDPYEAPLDADLVVDTRSESADEAADRVLAHLRSIGVVPAEEGAS
jgi:adenylylsulfate kinase-like enzyme